MACSKRLRGTVGWWRMRLQADVGVRGYIYVCMYECKCLRQAKLRQIAVSAAEKNNKTN